MSEQVTPGDERDELASVLHENFNKARGRGGVSPVLLADAVIAAGFRRVSPVTREALIRAIRVPVRWQGETPEEYMLDEDDAGMVADAIMPLLSASPPAEVTEETARSIFHDDEGYLREDLHAAGIDWQVVAAVETLTCGIDQSVEDYYDGVRNSYVPRRVKRADIADNSDVNRLALLDDSTIVRLVRKYAKARMLLGDSPEVL